MLALKVDEELSFGVDNGSEEIGELEMHHKRPVSQELPMQPCFSSTEVDVRVVLQSWSD